MELNCSNRIMLSHPGQEVRLASQIYIYRFILVEHEHNSSLTKRGCRWRVRVSREFPNTPIYTFLTPYPVAPKRPN